MPSPVSQGNPVFASIPQAPGTASFTMLSYDIAEDGTTRNVRVFASSGNERLDRDGVDAIARTRYGREPRTGCLYYFYRRQDRPVPAPPMPDKDLFRPAGATCGRKEGPWASTPGLVFPPAFVRRPFEGWAIVRYDRDASGATRNVRVAAAEPAETFGREAERIVERARMPAGPAATGCVTRVVFQLPNPKR
jgi:outer membrane biosynthesis protein TonB